MSDFELWIIPVVVLYTSFGFHLLSIILSLIGLASVPLCALVRVAVPRSFQSTSLPLRLLKTVLQPILPWSLMHRTDFLELDNGLLRPSRQLLIHAIWFLGPPLFWGVCTIFIVVAIVYTAIDGIVTYNIGLSPGATGGTSSAQEILGAVLILPISAIMAWFFFRTWKGSLRESLENTRDVKPQVSQTAFTMMGISLTPYRSTVLSSLGSILMLVVIMLILAVLTFL